jgi:hypothetical protein
MDALNWRKASYSAGNGGGCVEVGNDPRRVLVRDTQDRTGPVIKISPGAWRRFAEQVKRSLAGPQPGLQGVACGEPGFARHAARVCTVQEEYRTYGSGGLLSWPVAEQLPQRPKIPGMRPLESFWRAGTQDYYLNVTAGI